MMYLSIVSLKIVFLKRLRLITLIHKQAFNHPHSLEIFFKANLRLTNYQQLTMKYSLENNDICATILIIKNAGIRLVSVTVYNLLNINNDLT